ncbi:methyl-accepting chemotaxis protein [Agrobacterium larrymoorei]|uniref:MCP four helix bundle domain-containing protein n=2 Tax=Agrobacterium larrymoorei TaxID=160699 RepID=A0ABX8SYJ2_9HYPH|nr:methyl-accepting chemotaxis protein [Agrobacterium larrymoorei]QYA06047.1 MCP four helix bundle domain-containing protein [Agrobacterium larrymoorei]
MLNNFRIKTLLPFMFAVVVFLGAAQGAFSIYSVNQLQTELASMGFRLSRSAQMADLDRLLGDVRRQYAFMLGARNATEIAETEANLRKASDARERAFNAYIASLTTEAMKAKARETEAAIGEYEKAGAKLIQQKKAGQDDEAKATITELTARGTEAVARFSEMTALNKSGGESALEEATGIAQFSLNATILLVAIVSVIGTLAAVFSFRKIARPIDEITTSMNRLAANDTSAEVPHGERKDEIGAMSAAVSVFRNNAIERARLEQEADANRSLSEKERIAREEQKAREAADTQFAVDNLANGLSRLSEGDVSYRIGQPFVDHLDVVRNNFNASAEKLQSALSRVAENARGIDAGANEIRAAADDLAKRTEQQAASVEETAAALEEITTTVKDSTKRAQEAGHLVARARTGAEQSGNVVRKAVVAMEQIEKSSSEISNIISVIDEIAFQTNLLALNAGVEAARAGEAGKGFAVVAQEVRELAQRSANAAKDIKALITTSNTQVQQGVELVGETGRALETIVAEVQEINRHVMAIVESAQEQSSGLQQINTAVNQMDQDTQKNAAMVEESTAASHSLAREAASLNQLLGQFKLAGSYEAPVRAATQAERPAPSPARALGRKIASAFNGNAAVKQDWEEF